MMTSKVTTTYYLLPVDRPDTSVPFNMVQTVTQHQPAKFLLLVSAPVRFLCSGCNRSMWCNQRGDFWNIREHCKHDRYHRVAKGASDKVSRDGGKYQWLCLQCFLFELPLLTWATGVSCTPGWYCIPLPACWQGGSSSKRGWILVKPLELIASLLFSKLWKKCPEHHLDYQWPQHTPQKVEIIWYWWCWAQVVTNYFTGRQQRVSVNSNSLSKCD